MSDVQLETQDCVAVVLLVNIKLIWSCPQSQKNIRLSLPYDHPELSK